MAIEGKYYDARLFAGAWELTGQSNTIALSYNAAMLDATTMSMTTKANAPGVKDAKIDAAGFMSAVSGESDGQLFANVGLSTIPVTFFPFTGTGEGWPAYIMEAAQPEYTVGTSHGALAPYKFSAVPGSSGYPLVRGICLEPGSLARIITGNGTGIHHVGATASQKIYAALHVISAVVAGGNTLNVIIESDADGNFAAGATTRFTFTEATTITSQYMVLSGAVTDTYWRAVWTIAGGTPSFKLAVSVGII